MSTHGSPDVALCLVGGRSVIGTQRDLPDSTEAVLAEITGYGVAAPAWADTGARKATLQHQGWYDSATGAANDAIVARQGTSQVLLTAIEGNTTGKRCTGYAGAFAAKYTRLCQVAALHLANAEYTISGTVDRGVILAPLAARTTAGNTEATSVDATDAAAAIPITSSSVDNPTLITCAAPHGLTDGQLVLIAGHTSATPDINGERVATVIDATTFTIPVDVSDGGTGGTVQAANSLAGIIGHLQVTALTLGGYTNLVVTIADSDDDSTYTTLLTFTAATGVTAERKTAGTTVGRYLAIAWTWTGSGTGQTATFVVGAARA